MAKSLLLAPLLLLAACGNPDPAVPGGDVVGSWRELPDSNDDPTDVEDRIVLAFADDGTFTRNDGPQGPEAGTYELRDGRLILTTEGGEPSDFGYYADGNQLMFGILEPDDDGDDPVATWAGHAIVAGDRVDSTLVLGSDASAHMEQITADGTTTYDGTWAQTDDDVETTFPVEENYTISMSASLYAGFLGKAYEPI